MNFFCSNLAGVCEVWADRWVEGAFFLYQLKVHTFNCRHRTDRRVEGLVAEWVADSWRIHGRFMADSWRIHGGFMAE